MTDEQIIERLKKDLGFERTKRKSLQADLKAKEQECERLRFPMTDTNYAILTKEEFEQLDQLKAENDNLKNELHSKVEFIQEQRNIIDEYSKEIRMYKKCQGNRASKREEKLEQTLTEIKKDLEFEDKCQCTCEECGDECNPFWKKKVGKNDR